MKMTKDEALKKIEELKKYVEKEEKETTKLEIKSIWGNVLFESEKSTIREAVIERLESDANLRGADLRDADLSDANLRGADLRDADLRDAELNCAKFYGRGGDKVLKKSQLPDFLGALGFIVET
jgi:hypothetical protein